MQLIFGSLLWLRFHGLQQCCLDVIIYEETKTIILCTKQMDCNETVQILRHINLLFIICIYQIPWGVNDLFLKDLLYILYYNGLFKIRHTTLIPRQFSQHLVKHANLKFISFLHRRTNEEWKVLRHKNRFHIILNLWDQVLWTKNNRTFHNTQLKYRMLINKKKLIKVVLIYIGILAYLIIMQLEI